MDTNVSISVIYTGVERGCLKGLISFDWIRMQALCMPCSQIFRTSDLQFWFKPWQNWTLCGFWWNGLCWSLMQFVLVCWHEGRIDTNMIYHGVLSQVKNYLFSPVLIWENPDLRIPFSSSRIKFGQALKEAFRSINRVEHCSSTALFNPMDFKISLWLSSWPLLALRFCQRWISLLQLGVNVPLDSVVWVFSEYIPYTTAFASFLLQLHGRWKNWVHF